MSGDVATPVVDIVTDGAVWRVRVGGIPVAHERRSGAAEEIADVLRSEPGLAAEILRLARRMAPTDLDERQERAS